LPPASVWAGCAGASDPIEPVAGAGFAPTHPAASSETAVTASIVDTRGIDPETPELA